MSCKLPPDHHRSIDLRSIDKESFEDHHRSIDQRSIDKESFEERKVSSWCGSCTFFPTISRSHDEHEKEVGCNHAQSLGFSTDGFATTLTMRKLHLIWVTARMHIEIYKYPAWSDVIEMETWCQAEGRIGTRPDFIMKDYATGEVVGRATSKWVMMNQDTRRLERVGPEIQEEYLVFCPRKPRLAFPEENNKSLRKISKLEDPAHYSRPGLVSMPQEVINTHELQSITLDYRRECQHEDLCS